MSESDRPGASPSRFGASLPPWARLLAGGMAWLIGLLTAGTLMVAMLVGLALAVAYPNLPEISGLLDYRPKLPMRIYSADGVLLSEFGEERRNFTPIAQVPQVMQQALHYFAAQLEALAASTGLRFARVQIRRQRTRWGSCSARGTISVNICLAFLEPAVVRYLLVHELSHTRHMNHSARFWSLVEQHDPDYRQHDRELLRGWQRVPGWMFV